MNTKDKTLFILKISLDEDSGKARWEVSNLTTRMDVYREIKEVRFQETVYWDLTKQTISGPCFKWKEVVDDIEIETKVGKYDCWGKVEFLYKREYECFIKKVTLVPKCSLLVRRKMGPVVTFKGYKDE